MSCYNNCYLPIPPRAWSRVQNSCSLTTDIENNGLVKLPYNNTLVPASTLGEKIAMINKGNVLQYKANSSNLTQAQKYSKIAQGKWTNRNTTWATQSTRGYTNPNTSSLKRSGNVVNIAIDPITGAIIGQTNAPVTCPQPIAPINEGLPSNTSGGSVDEPEIPPPVPPTPASDTFPPTISDTPPEPIVIQDEGVLICSIQENVCTGETKSTLSQQLCNPTSDSDVPGTIQLLCWNDGTPTWYPRSRYIMTNSANKWPTNAVLFSSVRPSETIITSVTSNLNIVTLTWTQSEICLPVSFFNIFQDGILVQTVPRTIFTTDIAVNNCKTYEYFIIAVTNGSNISSEPSNIVSITISYIEPPTNLTYITIALGSIQLNWNIPQTNCTSAVSYNIYQDFIYIGNTMSLNYIINGLINCNTYTFSVSSLDILNNESTQTILTNVVPLWPNPPTITSTTWLPTNVTVITINFTGPSPNCSSPTSYTLYYSTDNFTTTSSITGINPASTSYDFTPTSYATYYFKMTSVNGLGESVFSTTVTASITLFSITGGSFVTTSNTVSATTTYNIVVNPGTSILTFNVLPDSSYANFQLVGGGGGGGGCWADISDLKLYSGAGGGGGGNLLVNNYVVNTNSYTITVGNSGVLGYSNNGLGDNSQTSGGPGGNSTITNSSGLNLIAYGGAGGGSGTSSSKSTGGAAGSFLTNAGGSGGSGGTGGNGNGGSSGDWQTGTSGTAAYFFTNNALLTFSPSNAFPTYYRPDVPNYPFATNPDSITLSNWYTVSGGGGAGDSTATNEFVSGNGGSGAGSGGLDGSNWSTLYPITNPPPYASFGGGGGGGGYITPGFPGGNGLVVVWFSYTI